MDGKAAFGKRIKELRSARALTQEQLAEQLGITWHYVSMIERGKGNPTLEMIFTFAHALGVDPVELFSFPAPTWNRKRAQKDITSMVEKADDKRLREIIRLLQAREG